MLAKNYWKTSAFLVSTNNCLSNWSQTFWDVGLISALTECLQNVSLKFWQDDAHLINSLCSKFKQKLLVYKYYSIK